MKIASRLFFICYCVLAINVSNSIAQSMPMLPGSQPVFGCNVYPPGTPQIEFDNYCSRKIAFCKDSCILQGAHCDMQNTNNYFCSPNPSITNCCGTLSTPEGDRMGTCLTLQDKDAYGNVIKTYGACSQLIMIKPPAPPSGPNGGPKIVMPKF